MVQFAARIDSVEALEASIGKAPSAIDLKVIDHLDETALRWLAASPLMFACLGGAENIGVTVAGGKPGFAAGDARALRLPLALVDDPLLMRTGAGFGSLFLIPGIGETLRINGRVAAVEDGEVLIAVEQCYVHCAKALIRSGFWSVGPRDAPTDDIDTFVAASRFMALATIDAAGGADLSPKGDPAGTMARIDGGDFWFADRPGNRRADSFRNILAQPRVALALLVPGAPYLAILSGNAGITRDETVRAGFEVNGKIPLLAIGIEDPVVTLRESPALVSAALWPSPAAPADINPAQMFVAHVKLNKDKGLQARLAGAMLSVPGLMQRSLDSDYKSKLY